MNAMRTLMDVLIIVRTQLVLSSVAAILDILLAQMQDHVPVCPSYFILTDSWYYNPTVIQI